MFSFRLVCFFLGVWVFSIKETVSRCVLPTSAEAAAAAAAAARSGWTDKGSCLLTTCAAESISGTPVSGTPVTFFAATLYT